ncbi:MAG: hypothetical protein ACRD4I_12990, partial [Candidatus Angelobacter sp.]
MIIVRRLFLANIALLVFLLPACNSSKTSDSRLSSKQGTASPQSSIIPDIDLNCVNSHLQNPPESFHSMFKDESD